MNERRSEKGFTSLPTEMIISEQGFLGKSQFHYVNAKKNHILSWLNKQTYSKKLCKLVKRDNKSQLSNGNSGAFR